MRRDAILRIAAGAYVRPRKVLKRNRNSSPTAGPHGARAARVLAAVPGAARKGPTFLPRASGLDFSVAPRSQEPTGAARIVMTAGRPFPPPRARPVISGVVDIWVGYAPVFLARAFFWIWSARFLLDLASARVIEKPGSVGASPKPIGTFVCALGSLAISGIPDRGVKR
jgi:hypothetical protein